MTENQKFTFKTLQADTPDHNGRFYSRETLELAVEKASRAIQENTMLGQNGQDFDAQDPTRIDLSNVTHRVTAITLEDGFVHTEIQCFPPLVDLIQSNELILALRGVGRVDADGSVHDLEIITFDLVDQATYAGNGKLVDKPSTEE